MTELKPLIEIIMRKIYHENIMFCEAAGLNNESTDDKIILLESINLDSVPEKDLNKYGVVKVEELANAIKEGKDLNVFGMVNGQKCIQSDLNIFLTQVKARRKSSVDSWVDMLKFAEVDKNLITFINTFMESHTEIENVIMMQAFLNKVQSSLKISIRGEDYEREYCNALDCIIEETQSRK